MNAHYTEQYSVPFRDDEPLVGPPPSCSWKSFQQPQLRRCPFDMAIMEFEGLVGGGIDGFVYKVRFGDQGPFALKISWQSDMPTEWNWGEYWPALFECQNAALLDMIRHVVEHDAKSIFLHHDPRTRLDAKRNLYAFSDEGREERWAEKLDNPDHIVRVAADAMPRLRQCFGWTTVRSETLANLRHKGMAPPWLTVPQDKMDRELDLEREDHLAIVYEFIPRGPNDREVVQGVMDFLWRAAFAFFNSPRDANWESGVLLDMAEIQPPFYAPYWGDDNPSHDRQRAEWLHVDEGGSAYAWAQDLHPDEDSVSPEEMWLHHKFVWQHEKDDFVAREEEEERRRKGKGDHDAAA